MSYKTSYMMIDIM